MNTPTQKRNGNDRSSTMRNFSDTGVAAARFQNFTEILADEIRAGVTPVTPESMAETDAVFAIDTILKFMKHRAVNSLTPEKNAISDGYTVRHSSCRHWKKTVACTVLPRLQTFLAAVNQR